MNFNKHVYNENQYATLIRFDRKVCVHFVAKVNDLNIYAIFLQICFYTMQ